MCESDKLINKGRSKREHYFIQNILHLFIFLIPKTCVTELNEA